MPAVSVRGATYHYEDHGGAGETLVFGHGFLFDHRMFDAQVRDLSTRYRCVAFDWRGQGRSEITQSGYEVDSLTEDAATLIATLGLAPCHFVGLSMGGFVGMRLAIRHAELLRSLVLVNTSAGSEPPGKVLKYMLLGVIARAFGLRPLVSQVMPIFFGATFMQDPEREDERRFWRSQIAAVDRVGAFRTLLGVVFRREVARSLNQIAAPSLVIAGEEDISYPVEVARETASRIPNAQFVVIPHAGHTSPIEQPAAVTQALSGFLGQAAMPVLAGA